MRFPRGSAADGIARGADGGVLLVRVGWLTPDLAVAVADDVRHAPNGTWIDFLVPDELAETELAGLRQLRWLISQHVRVDVRRAAPAAIGCSGSMGRAVTPPCGRLPQGTGPSATGGIGVHRHEPGTDLLHRAVDGLRTMAAARRGTSSSRFAVDLRGPQQ